MNIENEPNSSTFDSEGRGNCSGSSRHEPRNKQCYEIRFKRHLDDHWADWFHGYSLTRKEDGTTTMVAPVVDQAELFGLPNKVHDKSLSQITVNCVDSDQLDVTDVEQ